jgi:hypothetical protein
MALEPADVLAKGLRYIEMDYNRQSEASKKTFHKHYGSSPGMVRDWTILYFKSIMLLAPTGTVAPTVDY